MYFVWPLSLSIGFGRFIGNEFVDVIHFHCWKVFHCMKQHYLIILLCMDIWIAFSLKLWNTVGVWSDKFFSKSTVVRNIVQNIPTPHPQGQACEAGTDVSTITKQTRRQVIFLHNSWPGHAGSSVEIYLGKKFLTHRICVSSTFHRLY